MLNLISAFERGAYAVIGSAVHSGGGRVGTQTRIIRETSKGTIDRLIAALRTARAERDAARARVSVLEHRAAKLERDLAAYRHVADQLAGRLTAL